MANSTTVVYWNPQVIYGPLYAAHQAAAQEAAQAASGLAPGRIQVKVVPVDSQTANIQASGQGVVYQEFGTKPHEIEPSSKTALAGPNFGPVSVVDHPGNPALHFTRQGAETYPKAVQDAAKRLLPG